MINQIVLMGRLTKDPELRYTQSQKAVASFTLACERDYHATGDKPETDFIDVVAWGKTGEFVDKYFFKGDMMIVIGRIQNRSWTDKDGNKRVKSEINAEKISFCGSKRNNAASDQTKLSDVAEPDDDLPFA